MTPSSLMPTGFKAAFSLENGADTNIRSEGHGWSRQLPEWRRVLAAASAGLNIPIDPVALVGHIGAECTSKRIHHESL